MFFIKLNWHIAKNQKPLYFINYRNYYLDKCAWTTIIDIEIQEKRGARYKSYRWNLKFIIDTNVKEILEDLEKYKDNKYGVNCWTFCGGCGQFFMKCTCGQYCNNCYEFSCNCRCNKEIKV